MYYFYTQSGGWAWNLLWLPGSGWVANRPGNLKETDRAPVPVKIRVSGYSSKKSRRDEISVTKYRREMKSRRDEIVVTVFPSADITSLRDSFMSG